MANKKPSPTAANGRDSQGRFSSGNKAAKGNPHARRVAEFRAALMEKVTTEDIGAVVDNLIKLAKGDYIIAICEFLDRTIGKAVAMDLLQRIEAIEQALEERP